MRRLTVYIQIRGEDLLCGEIRGMSFEDACFSYDSSWLERKEAAAISLSLPLQAEAFDPRRTRAFFAALLPGGSFLSDLARLLRCRPEDYLSMLSVLGSDCRGGLKILEEDFPLPQASYEDLDPQALKRLAGGEQKDMASLLVRSSSALPGEAPCCCLRLREDGSWQLPEGDMTGTHLILQSRPLYERGLLNAALCMGAAKRLGIPAAGAALLGKGGDHRILLALERSDRVRSGRVPAGEEERILRCHLEDMGQALGTGQEKALERDYEGYMAAMFRLLRERAFRPIPDMISLWDRIVFNFLVGNLEGDVRSFGLLYSRDLRTLSLAPAGCISCTAMYDPLSVKLPFHIDGCYSPDSLTGRSFERMAPECGMGRKMGRERFDFLAGGLEKALYESAGELEKQGFEDAPSLAGQILEAGGIKNL